MEVTVKTARTSAIVAVIKDYSILMEMMTEVNSTTHDEYGLKAGGIVSALEKFSTLGSSLVIFYLVQLKKYPRACRLKIPHFNRNYHPSIWLQHSIGNRGQMKNSKDFMMTSNKLNS